LQCPERPKVLQPYAYNALLDARLVTRIGQPGQQPMLFESGVDRRNATDLLESFVTPHRRAGLVVYADGHVRSSQGHPSWRVGAPGAVLDTEPGFGRLYDTALKLDGT
jgi:prepilin-type processing-associated H-X9-DG protein